jgi:hypothetical protein
VVSVVYKVVPFYLGFLTASIDNPIGLVFSIFRTDKVILICPMLRLVSV